MAEIVEMDGGDFALLVHSREHGSYLVPPVVFRHLSPGVPPEMPSGQWFHSENGVDYVVPKMISSQTPAFMSGIDQLMAAASNHFGVPIGKDFPPRGPEDPEYALDWIGECQWSTRPAEGGPDAVLRHLDTWT